MTHRPADPEVARMTEHQGNPVDEHLTGLIQALLPFRARAGRLAEWGAHLARHLAAGGRLLVAGNGGSAAEAQHLAAELVGKLRDDRMPLSAIALTPDSSAVTAISNDYGFDEVFARQVRAHGRRDDVLVVLSTSGRSPNLIAAVHAAREVGMRTWAMVGDRPSPLAEICDEALCCPSPNSQVVQELHLVSVHLMCEYVDRHLAGLTDGVAPAGDHEPPFGPDRGSGLGLDHGLDHGLSQGLNQRKERGSDRVPKEADLGDREEMVNA